MDDKLNCAANEMMAAAKELTEQLRAKRAEGLNIIGTPPEELYNDIVDITALATGFKSAILTFIGKDKAYIKANANGKIGFEERADAFCNVTIQNPNDLLIVPDATQDERFKENWKVKDNLVIAYAGTPLVTDDGYAVGALCVIDDQPQTFKDKELELLKKMGQVVIRILSIRSGGKTNPS